MSDAIDLQQVMLAELRQFGRALAACVVVTPIAGYECAGVRAKRVTKRRPGAASVPTGAGASEAVGHLAYCLDPDARAGFATADRQMVAEGRVLHDTCREGWTGSASLAAGEHLLLTIIGQVDGRQPAPSTRKDGAR